MKTAEACDRTRIVAKLKGGRVCLRGDQSRILNKLEEFAFFEAMTTSAGAAGAG